MAIKPVTILLKQFAGELRTAFRTTDMVGRWGGDEFIVLVDADFRAAVNKVERIQKWVDGEYIVTTESGPRKVQVGAASGVASWQAGDTCHHHPAARRRRDVRTQRAH